MRINNFKSIRTLLLLMIIILIMISLIKSEPKRNKLTQKQPTALIIGAQKCGTCTLRSFIGEHPRVAACTKEQHFFSQNENYMKGVDWYLSQMPFSNEDQITLEKTPAYFADDKSPERVYALNPNMKLIVVVCDPVRRAISSYVHQKSIFMNNDPWALDFNLNDLFREYIHNIENDELIFSKCLNHESFKSSSIYFKGLYYENYKKWLKYFSKENFLFINGERFKKEPYVEMDKLQSFLGLEPLIRKEHFVFNEAKGFYCLKNPITSNNNCMGSDKGRKHPTIDEKSLDTLRRLYRLENEKFFKILDENMKPWWTN